MILCLFVRVYYYVLPLHLGPHCQIISLLHVHLSRVIKIILAYWLTYSKYTAFYKLLLLFVLKILLNRNSNKLSRIGLKTVVLVFFSWLLSWSWVSWLKQLHWQSLLFSHCQSPVILNATGNWQQCYGCVAFAATCMNYTLYIIAECKTADGEHISIGSIQ